MNEKLKYFGSTLVGAIDGFSGKLVSYFSIHRKNCIQVCEMYRNILLQYGIWDCLRVDHGTEFFLMLYLQNGLQHLRHDTTKKEFAQTTSRQVLF